MTEDRNMAVMDHPFSKSISLAEKYKRLMEIVNPEDTVAVLINADPDSIASALALSRLFWRKVKKTLVYHINPVKRADNLALIKLLKIQMQHIRKLNASVISKWAIVDSQPHHDEYFSKNHYDIIIDHHPPSQQSQGYFVDIKDEYGANSTIMTEYLRAAKIRPSPRLATALFYGIKTDTDNFMRSSTAADINAFRYLYQYVNMSTIKKIESSEMTKKTLEHFRSAMDNLIFVKDKAFVHMGKVSDPDHLVILADFFLKMAEITWCIVSGVYAQKLIVIFRNAGFRGDAGKIAQKLFGQYGTAGGHRSAARAEMPIQGLGSEIAEDSEKLKPFILNRIRSM